MGSMFDDIVVDQLPFIAPAMMATRESIAHGLPRHHHQAVADGDRATITT
jgi:hypothetical protein